jgi:two-component system NarL family response regulator
LAQQEVDDHFPADKLSPRELDVLRQAADGNSNRQIGHILGISEPTVKTHMSTILVKLGASDRTHAVTLALKRGYISL